MLTIGCAIGCRNLEDKKTSAPEPPRQRIRAFVAVEDVVASAVDIGSSGERKIFEIGSECEVRVRLHGVDTAVGSFDDCVACANNVGVITAAVFS